MLNTPTTPTLNTKIHAVDLFARAKNNKLQKVIGWVIGTPRESYVPVPKFYGAKELEKALYSGREAMLRWSWEDTNNTRVLDIGNIGNRKWLVYKLVRDLLLSDPIAKEQFVEDYGFVGTVPLDLGDFQERYNDGLFTEKEFETYREIYLKESALLVDAAEQILALIYENPILKLMLKTALEFRNRPISSEQFSEFHRLIEADGLNIIHDLNARGFRGNEDNHGSLFLDEQGQIVLHMDTLAMSNIQELIHEYAAFIIIRKSKNIHNGHITIPSRKDEELEKLKNDNLAYLLVILDSLSRGWVNQVINEYTHLAN